MISRAYYSAPISKFLEDSPDAILGVLARYHQHDLEGPQRKTWQSSIEILKNQLSSFRDGHIFFEFSIPRMGKRADIVFVSGGLVFVIEYKGGEQSFNVSAKEQVYDYALDLKHFHQGSHHACLIPIVLLDGGNYENTFSLSEDGLAKCLLSNKDSLSLVINKCLNIWSELKPPLMLIGDPLGWEKSAYKPTPTIIEAAQALYHGHQVEEISRSDAGAINLTHTTGAINDIIERAKANGEKAICFVTGVPGAGKTLAGLNIATSRMKSDLDEHAVFLSGNGPLVLVLQEALAKDEYNRSKIKNAKISIPLKYARRNAKSFVQSLHHFRDEYIDGHDVPNDHVVVFDEAQRAWNQGSLAKFLTQKRARPYFELSEPEFLIQVMDRHKAWCVIVALIGGGQEINTGEAGLPEWFAALKRKFSHWHVYYSDHMASDEYLQGVSLEEHLRGLHSQCNPDLHLGVSVRSFRAEKLSNFVQAVVANNAEEAKLIFQEIKDKYPICITRDISKARTWLKDKARGGELFGLVASSGANRLKPEGINVKAKISPVEWFLNGPHDVRSCHYLEDVATEFDVQGLELDWVGVCWDADFRYENGCWSHNAFKGTRWQHVKQDDAKRYLANSYRVLLTRARQGMVIYVPRGDDEDKTRPIRFYDGTYEFLKKCGIDEV